MIKLGVGACGKSIFLFSPDGFLEYNKYVKMTNEDLFIGT